MQNDDFFYILPSISSSLITAATKTVNEPILSSRQAIVKSYYEGLYHITSDEAADKIIESQVLYPSNRIASYGFSKRCFFFSGVPSFEDVCINVQPEKTLTAIRVKLPYEELAKFDIRSLNDGAISYKGNLKLDKAIVEKVRLGLKEKDGNLCYSPISEEEYKNYKVNVSKEKEKIINNKLAFVIRGYMAGLRKDYESLTNAIKNFMRDESSRIGLPKTRKDYIEENSDLFENTQEIPLDEISKAIEDTQEIPIAEIANAIENTQEIPIAEISEEEQTINLYNSIVNSRNKNLDKYGNSLVNIDDIKSNLLKSVLSNARASINQGIINERISNEIINSNMNEKEITDIIYRKICNGNIQECYDLLDNNTILYAACNSHIKSKNVDVSNDPVVKYFNEEIDGFNENLKQQNVRQNYI